MSTTVLVIVLLLGAAALVAILLLANAARGRRLMQDVPPAMRPAYSDDELETRVLERYMGWGLVLTLVFAIFLPLYWIREPQRLTSVTEAQAVAAFERGEALFVENCASCHGQNAEGGAAASTYDPDDSWPAPDLTTIVKRYEGTPPGDNIEEYLEQTIARGRPGTPMPAWGTDYGGPMTDQQMTNIADWILLQQKAEVEEATSAFNMSGEELYEQNCVRCHGRNLEGFVGPTLEGVFERHSPETIMGILRNGVFLANGVSMPPWQEGYMYPEARYTDSALRRIIDYLEEQQPASLPEDAGRYVTPYPGQDEEAPEGTDESSSTDA